MFHYEAWTDHRLVRVSLQLAEWPSLASYWKFNSSLLEIQDFQDRLESLVQRALVGAVTENKWWGSLKHRIRDFAKVAKSYEDKLSQMVEGGDSLAIDLARQELEHEANEHYKGYVVRSRLKSSQRSYEMQRVST